MSRRLKAAALLGALVAMAPLGREPRARAETRAAGVRFTDVASRSSFTYKSNNGYRSSGRKFFPTPMCGGVAVLDFDGDGLPDLFFTNGAKLPELRKIDASFYGCLLRNRGDGTFDDVTARARLAGRNLDFSFGVAAGDYDNDGRPDLFVCQAGRNALFHNDGDGTFTDVSARRASPRRRTCSRCAPPGSTTTTTAGSTSWSRTTRTGAPRPTSSAASKARARSIARRHATRASPTGSTATWGTAASRT